MLFELDGVLALYQLGKAQAICSFVELKKIICAIYISKKIALSIFLLSGLLFASRSDFSLAKPQMVYAAGAQDAFLNSMNFSISEKDKEEDFSNQSFLSSDNPELDTMTISAYMDRDTLKRKEVEKKIAQDVVLVQGGWKYKIKNGETLSHVSLKFGVSVSKILAMNGLSEKSTIKVGQTILLPDSTRPKATIAKTISRVVANFVDALTPIGQWLVPVSGQNFKEKHSNNGVDIAASCGQPVYAAGDGMVTESLGGYNGGYGNYIKVQHDDGSITLYGHLSERYAGVGNVVEKGTVIGSVGNTGKSTGCHLHFEVRGGTNFLLQ